MSQVKITDDQGRGIGGLVLRIADGDRSSDDAVFDFKTNSDGTQTWPIPQWKQGSYTIWVNTGPEARPDYTSDKITVTPQSYGEDQVLTITRTGAAGPRGTLTRLRVERSGFYTPSNQRVTLAGVSAFMHYERFLNGDDIRPLLAQAKELGANCVRVFGMAHYIPVNAGRKAFKPQDFGDRYFDQIPDFCRLCAEYGLYVYWSVFPDNELIGVPDPRGFLNRVVAKLKDVENTLGELTNEQDAHSFNHIDPTSMDRPRGIPFCSGSYGDIGGAQPHPYDFCDYHQPRRYDPPTHIKDSCVVDHPSYLQGYGVLLGEPDRYGTGGNPLHPQARMSAGASRETALGMIFHSTLGRESLLYDAATLEIATVFFQALIGGVRL